MKLSKTPLQTYLSQPLHLLNLMSEDLPAVVVTQAPSRHHARHSLGLEEDLVEADHGHLEGFVTGDLRLSLEETLRKMK